MSSRLLRSIARKLSGRDRRSARATLAGVLEQVRRVGPVPATVIDVGAAYGHFTTFARGLFPEARFVMIEPLQEYASALEGVAAGAGGVEHVPAAAGALDGELTINVHTDLVGSSLYLESEDSSVNGMPRTVPAVTLDRLIAERNLQPPFLLKIDVQGAELDVLAGGASALEQTECVLLEVSFFEFFQGGPQFHYVVAFMKSKGFVVYDIFGLQYRPLDGALSQADVAFVREAGPFREHHFYATRGQREEQDRSLRRQRQASDKAAG